MARIRTKQPKQTLVVHKHKLGHYLRNSVPAVSLAVNLLVLLKLYNIDLINLLITQLQ